MDPPPDDKPDLSGLRVLVAEDEFIAAMDIVAIVEDLGGELLGPVTAVSEGIALLRRDIPHMALLDVQLSDGLVTPLASALERLQVPFALVTGYQGTELETTLLRQAPLLSKPFHGRTVGRMAWQLCQEVIRRRAHAIWEREGRPEGNADRHWSMAEREVRDLSCSSSGPGSHGGRGRREEYRAPG
jgi:hypothetical protein